MMDLWHGLVGHWDTHLCISLYIVKMFATKRPFFKRKSDNYNLTAIYYKDKSICVKKWLLLSCEVKYYSFSFQLPARNLNSREKWNRNIWSVVQLLSQCEGSVKKRSDGNLRAKYCQGLNVLPLSTERSSTQRSGRGELANLRRTYATWKSWKAGRKEHAEQKAVVVFTAPVLAAQTLISFLVKAPPPFYLCVPSDDFN